MFQRGLEVHENCRKNYVTEKSIALYLKGSQNNPESKPVRSSIPNFSFKTHCFLCGEEVPFDYGKKQIKKPPSKRNLVYPVRKLTVRENVLAQARNRNDEYGRNIVHRVEPAPDLVAAEAQYHFLCMKNLDPPTRQAKGRRNEMENAMESIYSFLEKSDEECQFTMEELLAQVEGDLIPHPITVKRNLLRKYGDDILVTACSPYVVCFKATGYKIINESWYRDIQTLSKEKEKCAVVEAAAAIILEDVRSQVCNLEEYPPLENFLDGAEELIPETLKIFMDTVILSKKRGDLDKWKRKSIAIAHTIISAVRPASFLSPLQIGLGAFLYKKYGSRRLIDVLSSMGFCSSYTEVTRFEVSSIMRPALSINQQSLCQMVCDNADFNIQTLDGKNTFHTMGRILCITPKNSVVADQKIERLKHLPSAQVVGSFRTVTLKHFERNNVGLAAIPINDLNDYFPHTDIIVPSVSLLLWLYSKYKNLPGISGWNGFMEEVTQDVPYQTSFIEFQPFINAPPGEFDTIYTSLMSAVEKTRLLGQQTTIITFDQPLYLKARDIIASRVGDPELCHVVIRLGGFHLLMSFLGAVGYIMEGSGLSELLNTVYAVKSTEKIIEGHAYARAIRAHSLVFRALGTVIIESLNLSSTFHSDVEEILHSEDRSELQKAQDSDFGKEILQKFESQLQHLTDLGPTSKLWCCYFQMITLVLKFIESERSGNWNLHLQIVHEMLPYFHASGHYHYAKCAHLYLQDMVTLEHSMPPNEYEEFTSKGGFTIRRSDKCWCGTWTDMCIEQQLMKNMKVEGGLSRTRGFSEGVLARWTMGMSSLQHISSAIEDYCGVNFDTTDQHVDSRDARINLDNCCVNKMLDWFHQHPPFSETSELISISSGVVGGEKINCHFSKEVGTKGINRIIGNNYKDVKFKRSDRVLPLATVSSSVVINDHPVVVRPNTLFQRMVVAKQSENELEDFLKYELAPYPLALFDEDGMRKGTKSALYKEFKPLSEISLLESCTIFVIDGGFLLHKVVWPIGQTFEQICDCYINYVKCKYQQTAIIVFDGYSNGYKSIKSMERLRRSNKKHSVEIKFNNSMTPSVSQGNFLSNSKNKERLITMLMKKCEESGITSKQAVDDADTLIVRTAESLASTHKSVAIVGEDVDLLVIMIGLQIPPNVYFLKPARGKYTHMLYHPASAVESSVSIHMLFLHAISGCDSTSALYNQGKAKSIKTLIKNPDLASYIIKFNYTSVHPKEISDACEKFLIALYGGDYKTTTLNKLRYKQYLSSAYKVSTNMASIPPTEAAAQQHAFRVYFQVQQWIGNDLNPEQWGWKLTKNGLIPVTTGEPPAPEKLLQLISCKCKTNCQGRCGCRRSGLFCTKLCQQCEGSCSNVDDILDLEDEYDEEELVLSQLSEALKTRKAGKQQLPSTKPEPSKASDASITLNPSHQPSTTEEALPEQPKTKRSRQQ